MIIVTGASKNIGRYLFTRFKEEGEKVMGLYNSTLVGFEEDKELYYRVDISNYDDVCRWVNCVKGDLTHISLVNCAGMSYTGFAHKAEMERWEKVVQVNLIGTFHIIREILPIMRKEGYGRIINFSSVVAVYPTPGVSAYAASKAGLIGLTRSLAVENARNGVTVNAINLGYVNMGMGVEQVPPEYQDKILKTIPSGRFCEPEEIYNTVKFLIDTPYVNGENININGCLI